MMRSLWLVSAHVLGTIAVILVLPGMKIADAADFCERRSRLISSEKQTPEVKS